MPAEIVDPSAFLLPIHFPVEPSHPICAIWPRLLHELGQALKPDAWTSISAVRRGFENEA